MRAAADARPVLLLLTYLSTVTACDLGTGLRVETVNTSFELRDARDMGVGFTVENTGDATVYLARCGDALMSAVDRWESVHWEQYSGDLCPAVYPMGPLALAPGARTNGRRVLLEPGRYRLRLGNAPSRVDFPFWDATSNAFHVR